MSQLEIDHDAAATRFVARRDGVRVGLIDYRIDPGSADVLAVLHTETDPAARGQGIAADLTRAMLDYAASHGLRVRPVCPYTVGYLDRHPEFAALRA